MAFSTPQDFATLEDSETMAQSCRGAVLGFLAGVNRGWRKRELDDAGVDTSACIEQEPLLEVRPSSGVDHPVACHFAKEQAVV